LNLQYWIATETGSNFEKEKQWQLS
jgi:hypothetical protein